MGQTNYVKAKIADQLFGGTAYTPPATLYFALLGDTNTRVQRDAGTVTELSGSAYARVAVTNNTTNFPAATGTIPTTKSNGTAITWPTPTAGWAAVHAIGIYDASTSGNLLWWLDLVAAEVDGTVATSGTVTAPAHGFAQHDLLKFSKIDGMAIPGGLTDGAYYYVLATSLATDTFTVSTTDGGSAVTITTSGGGKWGKDLSQTPGSGSTVSIASSALVLTEN